MVFASLRYSRPSITRMDAAPGQRRWKLRACRNRVFALVVICVSVTCLPAIADPDAVDWRARFLEEAPKEWEKLQAIAGLEGVMETRMISPPPEQREFRRETRFFLNQAVAGQKFVMTALPDDGRMSVMGFNRDYSFHLTRSKPHQQLFLINFAPVNAKGEHDPRMVDNRDLAVMNWLRVANTFANAPLQSYVDGSRGRIRSVEKREVNGNLRIRLEIEKLAGSPPRPIPYRAWVELDPEFHWAIIAWENQVDSRQFRGTVEYQRDLPGDIAFPRRILEETYDQNGNLEDTTVMVFDLPRPCKLEEPEFRLESFGLEVPRNARNR